MLPDEARGRYVPVRGCSGCPHRGTCHEARQRVQDPLVEAGRHYLCNFFEGIETRVRSSRQPGGLAGVFRALINLGG